MRTPRILPVVPQPASQAGPPVIFQAPVVPATLQELAAISGLNASISTASSSAGWAFTASGIAYRCGAVAFTTTAGIAAVGQLFTVTFQHPFRGVPIVLPGGGPNCTATLVAANISATAFTVFNGSAISIASQTMQWIAIGV